MLAGGGLVCFPKAAGKGSILIFLASGAVVGGDRAEVDLGFVFSEVLESVVTRFLPT